MLDRRKNPRLSDDLRRLHDVLFGKIRELEAEVEALKRRTPEESEAYREALCDELRRIKPDSIALIGSNHK